jgi:hypothetical protein
MGLWLAAAKGTGGGNLPKRIHSIVMSDPSKWKDSEKKSLKNYFVEFVLARTRGMFDQLHKELAGAEKALAELDNMIPRTLVSHELKEPRAAFILRRGEYDQKGDKVQRHTPQFLPPMPPGAPNNRLGFARWLTAADNPLTARVVVNRLWQHCFGTGIVKTAEDFGAQGEPPSHKELLDWLAVTFREGGWNVKEQMKRMVTSATYRQTSKVSPDRLAKDPANRLLSRGPRYRLDAEMLRDQALAVSGLLVEKIGGPSVKPPQPAGLWEAVGYTASNTARFTPDHGNEKVHRRSMYTFWKRTAPPPQMNILDAPSREACTVRRERTDTPLQALLLLNETQFVEAARALGGRSIREGGPAVEGKIGYLFRLATARRPDAAELAELVALYRDQLKTYAADAKAAEQLIKVGESSPDPKIGTAELAAMTMVANLVLNLDSVLCKE